jgi:hypothetical protein
MGFPWTSTVRQEGKTSFPEIPKTFPSNRIVHPGGN